MILYHNKFAETSGWIKTSAAYVDKGSGDLRQRSLAEGLDLPYEGYVIFKDYVTHLEYIRSCSELWENGLFVQLGAYQHHAFLDWRVIPWDEKWQAVHDALNGAGAESVQANWDEMFGVKEEAVEEKPKKVTKKRTTKKAGVKKPAAKKKTTGQKGTKKATPKT